MAIVLRRLDISSARITMLFVVFAGIKNPPLNAQSIASVAVYATVLQDHQRTPPAATFELVDPRGASALPAGSFLLAAARGKALAASLQLSAIPAPAEPLEASSSPGGSLPWRDALPVEPKGSGPPEHTPTVRLTVAYTAN